MWSARNSDRSGTPFIITSGSVKFMQTPNQQSCSSAVALIGPSSYSGHSSLPCACPKEKHSHWSTSHQHQPGKSPCQASSTAHLAHPAVFGGKSGTASGALDEECCCLRPGTGDGCVKSRPRWVRTPGPEGPDLSVEQDLT